MYPARSWERKAATDSSSKEHDCSYAKVGSDEPNSDERQREPQERGEGERREIASLALIYDFISKQGDKPITEKHGKGPQGKNENKEVDEVDERKLLGR